VEAVGVSLDPDPRFWLGRRVLVTGHTGFKGSWLTLWLLELGADVHGLALPAGVVTPPQTLSSSDVMSLQSEQARRASDGMEQSIAPPPGVTRLANSASHRPDLALLTRPRQPAARETITAIAGPVGVAAAGPLFAALGLARRLRDRHHMVDIRDGEQVAAAVAACRPQVVLHLAAQPLVRQSYNDPRATWSTNVQGTLELLEALRPLRHPCAVVLVTTDKVYANREWEWGYREDDRLGGHDPYSASKAAMELLASSWRASFCGGDAHQNPHLAIATARAGNVIGGGDWAADRIVPDAVRALAAGEPIPLRHPAATRPWQHVLEPLAGYLQLARYLSEEPQSHGRAYNFGPAAEANQPVAVLVEELLGNWPEAAGWRDVSRAGERHEAALLHLVADRARRRLDWRPRWDFATTVARTAGWYRRVLAGASALDCCLEDLEAYRAAGNGG